MLEHTSCKFLVRLFISLHTSQYKQVSFETLENTENIHNHGIEDGRGYHDIVQQFLKSCIEASKIYGFMVTWRCDSERVYDVRAGCGSGGRVGSSIN